MPVLTWQNLYIIRSQFVTFNILGIRVRLLELVNKNSECQVTLEFQINNK